MTITILQSVTGMLRCIQTLAILRRKAIDQQNQVQEGDGKANEPSGGQDQLQETVTQSSVEEVLRDLIVNCKQLGECYEYFLNQKRLTDSVNPDNIAKCVSALVKSCTGKLEPDQQQPGTGLVRAIRTFLDLVDSDLHLEPVVDKATTAAEAAAAAAAVADDQATDSLLSPRATDDEDDDDDDEDADTMTTSSEAIEEIRFDDDEQTDSLIGNRPLIADAGAPSTDADANQVPAAAGRSEDGDNGGELPPMPGPVARLAAASAASSGRGNPLRRSTMDPPVPRLDVSVAIGDGSAPSPDDPPSVAPLLSARDFSSRASAGSVISRPTSVAAASAAAGTVTSRPRSGSLLQRMLSRSKMKQPELPQLKRSNVGSASSTVPTSPAIDEWDADDREAFLNALVPKTRTLYTIPTTGVPVNEVYVRSLLLNEIYQTEALYLRDIQLMVRLYRDPALKQGMVKPTSELKVFGNLRDLIMTESKLLNMLDLEFQQTGGRHIADVFLKARPSIAQALEQYSVLFPGFAREQKKVRRKSHKFKELLADPVRKTICGRQDLSSLQAKPVQRLCRYPLLFRGLVDACSTDDEMRGDVIQVLVKYNTMVDNINRVTPLTSSMSTKKKRSRVGTLGSTLTLHK